MKRSPLLVITGLLLAGGACLAASHTQAQAMELSVPYVSQVPDGAWVAPWDEACEEASTAMLNGFYERKKSLSKETSKKLMQRMIDWEKETFQNYQDTTAEETTQLIQEFGSFTSEVVRNPSLESIKVELDAQRPVIALVNMYTLYQEQPLGDSYHVLVLVGYDDVAKEFFVNDPAREQRRYPYERVMDALHDYNKTSKEADGEPTVLFTAPRQGAIQSAFSQLIQFFRNLFA